VQSKAIQKRGAKQKFKPGIWWSPMDIALILEQVQQEIKIYQCAEPLEGTAEGNHATACERLTKFG